MSAVGGAAALDGVWPAIAEAAETAKGKLAAAVSVDVKHVKSICVHCVNFCGIDVETANGVIRSITPDKARAEFHNWGICPKGVSGLFNTYNPYRLKKPMKRTNPNKGPAEDPKWVEISWDEAFDTMAARLKKIKADNPAKFIWQHGHGKYLIGDQFPKALCAAFGTPNLVHRTTTCESARHVADELTWGYHGILPDVDRCNLLLNFGANYFEGEQWARWLDHSVIDARERGMKLVSIEPRLSQVGAKSDEWVPVRPGKDVVLLLAMAKVLIDDGTLDEPFLTTYTNAPNLVKDDGRFLRDKDNNPLVWDTRTNSAKPYAEGVVPALKGNFNADGAACRTSFQVFADSLKDITPQYAEEVAGVPAATVTRLARQYAAEARIGSTIMLDGQSLRYRPVCIHTFRGLSAKEFGVQSWRAGLVVQMLVGALDAVGGLHLHDVFKSPKYMEAAKCEYPPKRVDLAGSVYFPNGHHDVCQQVALTLLDPKAFGLAYEPEMQIFYATNRPFSTSNAMQQFEGLKKTWNVVIDVVMTELAWYADIVLPDLTYLESWHFAPTRWNIGAKHSAIRQPVVNAFNIPHDGYSIIFELAKRLDLRDKYLTEVNSKWGLKEHKFQPGRDYTAREAVEIIWLDKAHEKFDVALEKGFVGKKVKPKDLFTGGGSVEAKFKGPGKPKMALYAEHMVHTFAKVEETVKKNGIRNVDLERYRIAYSPLPIKEHAFPTPHREAKDFPFYVITHKSMYRNQSGNTSTNPILNALGPDTQENRIAINKAAAAKLNVRDGDRIVIETRIGQVTGKARLTEGIRPDTVAVSYHYGQWSPGLPFYARKGVWINKVLELHPDLVSGMNSFNDTKCKVYKA
ncbi:MAG: molybdopterin-dependent oxidoreductase [Betaproteobacteria bacterium]|nr:molybdopterin-dependent oxidoreductase [Betaproteobacteria bacterium]